ncbi:channel protein TolC [Acidovorax sp. SRB_14]|uniref:TolC family outer membrane protein n=1 Tax=unclassified Acidovorax TaxID=2684926 RepID=UPI00145F7144|nr:MULTISPECIES: TolC family outer membrane protein [unclassified Acidovorax]NMM77973.1 channel protein TolC [Acidovorax sp. SRB_24]NMM78000.1 channel protein TolC [Acidovorax sp. SRB_24]NMM79426.1 channel protein TolC [Acidovorax sp. SRB_14]
MHLLRHLPLTLALGAALAAPAQAQSLLQLLESARGYDAPWQSAKAQLDASVSRAAQARAGLLPSAALSAGVTRAQTEINPRAMSLGMTTQNAGINATQPLYRPANRITLQQGLRGIDVAQAQLDAVTQDLLVRVSQGYFDVLAAQDTLTFVQAQKAAVSEQLAAAKRNFEVGTSTITDTREAQARYDLVIAQEIAAENDLRVKKLALDQLVGQSGTAPLPLAQPLPLPALQPSDVGTWVQQAVDAQPLVRQAAIALDVARLETKKAETGHLPTVDLQAGYNVQRTPNGTLTLPGVNSRTNSTSVGVALNLPLFAGFAVQNRVKETLALEEKARADLEDLRRTVAQNTRAAFFGVQSGESQVKALEAAEQSSQSALDANKLGYQVGVRINIDVLNAQSQLYQTKRDLAQARYNVLLGTLKLRQSAGILQEGDLQAIEALLVKNTP